MKNRRATILILILIAAFIVTACNLPFSRSKDNSDLAIEEPTKNSDSIFNLGSDSSNNKKEVNSKPVGIQDGLGSLDSYRFYIYVNMYDSTGTINKVESNVERSVVDGNVHQTTTITSFDPEDDDEVNTDTTETYTVGTETCTSDDDAWDYKKIADDEKELRDIFTGMVDFLPLINDPVFVGEETLNGVDTNHFTFKVEGIGDSSGAVANVNNGEYWLAVDGDYIVKYNLTLEIQTAADGSSETKTGNLEVQLNLTDINQTVSISLPDGCYAK
jgi:hypothetical protein